MSSRASEARSTDESASLSQRRLYESLSTSGKKMRYLLLPVQHLTKILLRCTIAPQVRCNLTQIVQHASDAITAAYFAADGQVFAITAPRLSVTLLLPNRKQIQRVRADFYIPTSDQTKAIANSPMKPAIMRPNVLE